MIAGGRNGIEAACVPGMTATEAARGKPAAAPEPVYTHGFLRVMGAAGMEATAVGEPGAQQ